MPLVPVKMLRDVPARGLRAGAVVEVRAPIAYTMCRRGDAEPVRTESPPAARVEAPPAAVPAPAVVPLPGPHTPLAPVLAEHARKAVEESKPKEAESKPTPERHEKKRRWR